MESTITRLLRGSQEYDRMRSEIKQIVNIVCSLIDAKVFTDLTNHMVIERTIRYQDGEVSWVLMVNPRKHRTMVFVGYPGGSTHSGAFEIPLAYVKLVHSTLTGFVEKMIEPWPEVGNKLNLLLTAGDIALSK
jgi:hypothetical protein